MSTLMKNDKTIAGLTSGMKLLWENPNTTQAFNAQTITLNSADYDFLMVIWNNYLSPSFQFSAIMSKGASTMLAYTNAQSNYPLTAKRHLNWVSNTSYSVDDAVSQRANATDTTTNNNFCIPVAIYGIKL